MNWIDGSHPYAGMTYPSMNPNYQPFTWPTVEIPSVSELGHPEYLKILDEMKELHCRKAADYGRGVDPLANVRAAVDFGIPAWVGVMIRANDKMHRIKSFLQNGELKNESVEDSLKDLAAYALIALVLFREDQAKQ